MKKSAIITIVVAAILIIALAVFFTRDNASPTESNPLIPTTTHTVQITETGFVPAIFTIKKGESVKWVNNRESPSWPASASHPSHTIYPDSGITKCGTLEESNIFDACRGLQKGQSFTFTFNEVGSWNYHDHLVTSFDGRIIVEP